VSASPLPATAFDRLRRSIDVGPVERVIGIDCVDAHAGSLQLATLDQVSQAAAKSPLRFQDDTFLSSERAGEERS
jgi:hypothetical protein